jgi:type I restriction enzyme S subunit
MNDWKDTEIGLIPKDWQVLTLDKISELLTDGSHLSPKESFEGKYMASVKDMRYGGFDFTSCKKISDDDYQKLKQANCYPQKGDILISKDGANCLDIIFVYNQE